MRFARPGEKWLAIIFVASPEALGVSSRREARRLREQQFRKRDVGPSTDVRFDYHEIVDVNGEDHFTGRQYAEKLGFHGGDAATVFGRPKHPPTAPLDQGLQ